jgi:transposase
MPKHVHARAAQDAQEERQVSKLARSLHAPADWKFHAQMVMESWAGKTPNEIASELDCHPQTVRIHLARFNAQGISGLGMQEGAGRKPRLSEQERSRILALAKQPPPGRLERYAETLEARDETGPAQWSLDALTEAAHDAGIQVERELRSGGFICAKGRAGAAPTVGAPVMIKISSQKDRGRHPLHRATRRVDDHLHR